MALAPQASAAWSCSAGACIETRRRTLCGLELAFTCRTYKKGRGPARATAAGAPGGIFQEKKSRGGLMGAGRSQRLQGWGTPTDRRCRPPASSSSSASALVEELAASGPLPALAVLDLDHTLFACYLDMNSVGPPFVKRCEDSVTDSEGNIIRLYPQSREVIQALNDMGVGVCIASRSPVGGWYRQILDELDLLSTFDPVYIHGGGEIGFPGTKLGHFINILESTSLDFDSYVFFDDEYGNIEDMEGEGVTSVYVTSGLDVEDLREAIAKWRAKSEK